jgi:hypothetical protein
MDCDNSTAINYRSACLGNDLAPVGRRPMDLQGTFGLVIPAFAETAARRSFCLCRVAYEVNEWRCYLLRCVGRKWHFCMDRPCVASRILRSGDNWSGSSVFGPLKGAFCSRPSWISAHIRSHSRQGPGRPYVPPDHGCDGQTVSPSPQSNSQTSAGITGF